MQAEIKARRLGMVNEGRLQQKKEENRLKHEAKLQELEVNYILLNSPELPGPIQLNGSHCYHPFVIVSANCREHKLSINMTCIVCFLPDILESIMSFS